MIVANFKDYSLINRCFTVKIISRLKNNSYTVCYKSNGSINFVLVKNYLKCFIQCPVGSFCDSLCACLIPMFIANIEKLVLFSYRRER